ncbi:MAG: type II toxin-antitoxin system VapC family toxin [Nanoarchaeota archaeon]
MVCLDTDVIIDFLKKDKEIYKKIAELKEEQVELSTTTINAFELFRGNRKLSEESKEDSVDIFLNNVRVHKFALEDSKKAAEIFEQLKSRGEIIELTDVMIASVAIMNNESLLTRNKKHFERIDQLKLEKV